MLLGDMTGHCALMDKGKRAHWAWQASKRSNRDVLMQGFHRIVVSEHMLEPTSSESINVHPGTRMWSKCSKSSGYVCFLNVAIVLTEPWVRCKPR